MSALQKKLDTVFSKWIRARDCNGEFFKCISCGQIKPSSQADAGHYYSRRYLALRYDEKNVNAQCRHCNRFMEGNRQGYMKGLVEKYGGEVLEYLETKKNNRVKFGELVYKELLKIYSRR